MYNRLGVIFRLTSGTEPLIFVKNGLITLTSLSDKINGIMAYTIHDKIVYQKAFSDEPEVVVSHQLKPEISISKIYGQKNKYNDRIIVE